MAIGGRVDVGFFLKRRTELIRFFYTEGVKPFLEIHCKIEQGLSPFDDPPYSEDPEPPFVEEWMNAATGIELVGQSCVSLLSDALKLYFNTLQKHEIGFAISETEKSLAKEQGFVALYKKTLGEILDTDWADCPASFDVIEQVVLARNRSQHGSDLISHHVRHDSDTLRKHPRPFFARDEELKAWEEAGGNEESYFVPMLEITQEKLFAATYEIDKLVDWIDGRMDKAWEWRRRAASSNE
jgi:hypothetical protein